MATKKDVTKEVELVTSPIAEEKEDTIDLVVVRQQENNPILVGFSSKIEDAIKAIDDCIVKDDIGGAYAAEKLLSSCEKEYAEQKAACIYADLGKSKTPILDAIKLFKFTVPSHRVIKTDDGVISEIEVGEKERYVDLYKMCSRNKLSLEWSHYVSRLNQLLCLRAAKELKYTDSERKQLAKTYYLSDVVKKIELGETPDSNNQICKLLQIVIDKLLYLDDGSGKNVYKCNNHDVAFLLALYTKKGKSALSVCVSKDKELRSIIASVLRRIVSGEKYSLEGFKTVKNS